LSYQPDTMARSYNTQRSNARDIRALAGFEPVIQPSKQTSVDLALYLHLQLLTYTLL